MRIGKQAAPDSAISTATAERITVRGFDLTGDLIGSVSFANYFYLLLTNEQPTPAIRALVGTTLVAIAEHGLIPSEARRMTLATAPDAWQGAVAAGIFGFGSVVLDSAKAAGPMLGAGLPLSRESIELRLPVLPMHQCLQRHTGAWVED